MLTASHLHEIWSIISMLSTGAGSGNSLVQQVPQRLYIVAILFVISSKGGPGVPGLASPTSAPTLRRSAHSAARSVFQDATPAKFGARASSAPKIGPDQKLPRNGPSASRGLHRTAGGPPLASIDLTEVLCKSARRRTRLVIL